MIFWVNTAYFIWVFSTFVLLFTTSLLPYNTLQAYIRLLRIHICPVEYDVLRGDETRRDMFTILFFFAAFQYIQSSFLLLFLLLWFTFIERPHQRCGKLQFITIRDIWHHTFDFMSVYAVLGITRGIRDTLATVNHSPYHECTCIYQMRMMCKLYRALLLLKVCIWCLGSCL